MYYLFSQIQIFAYKQLSPSKEVKSLLKDELALSMSNVLQHLISIITNSLNPLYVKAKLLQILELVHSKVSQISDSHVSD